LRTGARAASKLVAGLDLNQRSHLRGGIMSLTSVVLRQDEKVLSNHQVICFQISSEHQQVIGPPNFAGNSSPENH
jgi:hypothetical protein